MIEKILEYITKRCIYIRMKLQTCVGYSQAEKNVRLEELYTIKQECERMRKYHNKCCEEFEKEKKEWLEKYNQVSRDFCSGKYCNAEKCQQLNRLNAEIEELKKVSCKFKDYCTCDTEKLKQTLTEIREIAENREIFCENCGGGVESFTCDDCGYVKILQKISEVME